MDELTKVKVLLMQEVKGSNLPKGGRVLLLNLIADNENLSETAEILEAFEIIDEKVKEKIKTWLKKHKKGLKEIGKDVGAFGLGAAGTGAYLYTKKHAKELKKQI